MTIQAHKISDLKEKYEEFKTEPFYQNRLKQLAFVDWAREVILETLKVPLTNESITGLIQVLKHGSKLDNIRKYLERNIPDIAVHSKLYDSYIEIGQTGFTGAGKTAVKKLSPEQLGKFHSFLLDASQAKSVDEAVALVTGFMKHNIPEVKSGVYSPWLYYLNPHVFPIFNNSHAEFVAWCEQVPGSYPVAIRLFHEVGKILGEENLGLVDAFAHKFINEREEGLTAGIAHATQPLNTILYGPPGTGKTYNAINKAVQLINPSFFNEKRTREEVRSEYERLIADGQIEFITFHQSMSYEDFIEGIKPKKPEEGDEFLRYIIEEGLFKKIAKRAAHKPTQQEAAFSLNGEEFSKASYFKISLGNTAIADDEQIYRYCIDNGYIALGYGGAKDFTGKTEHDIQKMVPAELEKFAAQAVTYFIHYLKKDDFVVVSYGNLRFRAIGKVTGEYEYRNVDGLEVKQFRKVRWLLKDVDIPVEEIYNKQFSQQSIYKLNKLEIKREFFLKAPAGKQSKESDKNYVLIIDEINRGNVAQIFGELITLIEPDKRKGAPEALEVILPYSKEPFSVPSNLFLLGTMNTADRSVEALDTALRRRFMFEEMMPKPELLSPRAMVVRLLNSPECSECGWDDEPYRGMADALYDLIGASRDMEEQLKPFAESGEGDWSVEELSFLEDGAFAGVNLQLLLEAINRRLLVLLTKDHTIGHAWLMDVYKLEDLQSAFKNKILPLLQEYFYNNYSKIGLVLGDAFVYQATIEKGLFATFKDMQNTAGDYEGNTTYKLADPFSLNIKDFQSIYANA